MEEGTSRRKWDPKICGCYFIHRGKDEGRVGFFVCLFAFNTSEWKSIRSLLSKREEKASFLISKKTGLILFWAVYDIIS